MAVTVAPHLPRYGGLPSTTSGSSDSSFSQSSSQSSTASSQLRASTSRASTPSNWLACRGRSSSAGIGSQGASTTCSMPGDSHSPFSGGWDVTPRLPQNSDGPSVHAYLGQPLCGEPGSMPRHVSHLPLSPVKDLKKRIRSQYRTGCALDSNAARSLSDSALNIPSRTRRPS